MAMFGREFGSKTGSAGVASATEANVNRRERLRALALETADLTNDPYFMKNHIGSYECKLCLTLHTNEGSYLAHTQGKRHQTNLAKRNAKLDANKGIAPTQDRKRIVPKKTIKIGRPGYKVIKQRDAMSGQRSLLFQLQYPLMGEDVQPRHRFMSTYEQKLEKVDPKVQYLLFAAEPYETVSFKIPRWDLDKSEGKFFTHWDPEKRSFTLQLVFKKERREAPTDSTGQPLAQPDRLQPAPSMERQHMDVNEEDDF